MLLIVLIAIWVSIQQLLAHQVCSIVLYVQLGSIVLLLVEFPARFVSLGRM
jgi:hypothetical protein